LKPGEDRLRYRRVENDRDVKRPSFVLGGADKEGVRDPVPPQFISPMEIHVNLRVEEGVESVAWVERVYARLAAVTENRHEPIVDTVALEGVSSVILRPAHNVSARGLSIHGKALVLKR